MSWASNWFQSWFRVEKCLRNTNLASFLSLGDSKGVKKGLLSKISNFALILGNFGESMKQVEFQNFSRWIWYTKGQSTMGSKNINVYASELRKRGKKQKGWVALRPFFAPLQILTPIYFSILPNPLSSQLKAFFTPAIRGWDIGSQSSAFTICRVLTVWTVYF